jgi:hypothetical protein
VFAKRVVLLATWQHGAPRLQQGLNVTAQLDAGVRFFDFRIQFTDGPVSERLTTLSGRGAWA